MAKFSDRRSRHLYGHMVGTIRQLGHTDVMPWEIMPFGQELPIEFYPELFAKIGHSFGTPTGPNLFKLPDLRGVCLVGLDKYPGSKAAFRVTNIGTGNPGIDGLTIGSRGGVDRRKLQFSELPSAVMTLLNSSGVVAAAPITAGTGGAPVYQSPAASSYPNMPPAIIVNFALNVGRNLVYVPPIPTPPAAPTGEEFNGPFDDWINVVRDFGAVGDGVTDDTEAFQNCINAACGVSDSVVPNGFEIGSLAEWQTHYLSKTIYVPDGTYLITAPLRLGDTRYVHKGQGAKFLSIIGQHPDTTILKWGGETVGENATESNIMWMAGMHDGLISRLTFDGNSKCWMGLRLEQDPTGVMNQSYNRIEWCYFKDCAVGFANTDEIFGTNTDSECSVYGCRFYRCTEFGANGKAGEAYDYWFSGCYFEECEIACGIQFGKYLETLVYEDYGDRTDVEYWHFNVGDCIFNGSKKFDITCYYPNSSFRNNVSVNSFRFMKAIGLTGAITGNRIINPVNTDCIHTVTNFFGNAPARVNGYYANNEFHLRPGATGPVYIELYTDPDVIREVPSVPGTNPQWSSTVLTFWNNKFNVSYTDVFQIDMTKHKFYDDDDEVYFMLNHGSQFNQTISTEVPALLSVPPNVTRPVYNINWGDPSSTMEEVMEAVADNVNLNPVIYITRLWDAYRMSFTETMEFPANIPMSIQGAGGASNIGWVDGGYPNYSSNSPHKPLLLFRGPTKCKMKYVKIPSHGEGGKAGIGVMLDNCDQVGSRVILDNLSGCIQVKASHTAVSINAFLMGSANFKITPTVFETAGVPGNGYTLIDGSGTGQGPIVYTIGFDCSRAGLVTSNRIHVLNATYADEFVVGAQVQVIANGGATITGLEDEGIYWIVEIVGDGLALSDTEGGEILPISTGLVSNFNSLRITADPRTTPFMHIKGGARVIIRNVWNEQYTDQRLVYQMTGQEEQRGFLGIEGCRLSDLSIDPTQFTGMPLKVEGWKGDYVTTSGVQGKMRGINDFGVMTFGASGGTFYDDGGIFNTYDGDVLITCKGMILDTQSNIGNATYDDAEAAYRNLPGYPDSYDGEVGDWYLAGDTLHFWAWDGDVWVDVGGWIGAVTTPEHLPGWPDAYISGIPSDSVWVYDNETNYYIDSAIVNNFYINVGKTFNRPRTGDCFFVRSIRGFYKWSGTVWEIVPQTGNLPDHFFGFGGTNYPIVGLGVGSTSRYQVKMTSTMPGVFGELWDDSERIMDFFNLTRVFLCPVANDVGITDFAARVVQADFVITADTYVAP